ncbi:MAG: EamA family transporter [Proteobacteria bacterium]|nr:EamA family transporter [Pseudomonadota bacterium]
MKPSSSFPRPAAAALLLMSLIWGYNWVVMKQVIRYADPFDFSAIRTLLGALSLFALLLLRRRPLKLVAARQTILLGLLQTAAFTALIQWALVAGGAGKTAVLVYTMPFWLVPLAAWRLGEHISPLQQAGTLVAAGGLLLILEPWGAAHGSLTSNLLALAGSLAWALATVVAKRLRQQHEVDVLTLTAWQMLFGALALCVVAALHPSRPIDPTPYFFGALAFNALLATGLAWLLWLYVLEHLPAAIAGLSALGIPAIGVLAGWLELGERPSNAELGGMLLIGAALLLVNLVPVLRRGGPPRS